ncbi:hypothetical protein [Aeromonas jandaei]|uniref:hypothetical protein n=1 Tax=Aeromonas jandaei TaxID=650 RepID=UPI003F7A126A
MVHITLIYAGLLGLLFLGLSAWVVRRRAQFGVMIGQGEAPELLAGRVLHAIGIQIPRAPNVPRFVGTLLFWLSLGLFSGLTLFHGLING